MRTRLSFASSRAFSHAASHGALRCGRRRAAARRSTDAEQSSSSSRTRSARSSSDNCYKCHSVEQGKAKGGLTLDTREGLLKGGDNGAGVVPGDPEKSLLIKAVSYNDPDLQMPPKGEKLTTQQIADLDRSG